MNHDCAPCAPEKCDESTSEHDAINGLCRSISLCLILDRRKMAVAITDSPRSASEARDYLKQIASEVKTWLRGNDIRLSLVSLSDACSKYVYPIFQISYMIRDCGVTF